MRRKAFGAALGIVAAAAALALPMRAETTTRAPLFTFRIPGNDFSLTAMTVDAGGTMYIAGSLLYGAYFPVTDGALERDRREMFVAKIAPGGDRVVWATYLGGRHLRPGNNYSHMLSFQGAGRISVDPQGNVLVGGWTYTDDFPVVNAAVGTAENSGTDGFLVKISSDGTRLLYATYLGAGLVAGLSTDYAGNAYVAMNSSARLVLESRNLSAPGVLGTNVVIKMNPAGQPIFATRFGGTYSPISSMAVDYTGATIVGGSASQSAFPLINPAVAKCYQYPSGQDCVNPFVTKLDPTGSRLVFSTFLGGRDNLSSLSSLAVDPSGNVFVTGSTKAGDFPIRNAFQSTNRGGADSFLTKLAADGSLVVSTFVGTAIDDGTAVSSSGPRLLVDVAGQPTLLSTTSAPSGPVPALDHPTAPVYVTGDGGCLVGGCGGRARSHALHDRRLSAGSNVVRRLARRGVPECRRRKFMVAGGKRNRSRRRRNARRLFHGR